MAPDTIIWSTKIAVFRHFGARWLHLTVLGSRRLPRKVSYRSPQTQNQTNYVLSTGSHHFSYCLPKENRAGHQKKKVSKSRVLFTRSKKVLYAFDSNVVPPIAFDLKADSLAAYGRSAKGHVLCAQWKSMAVLDKHYMTVLHCQPGAPTNGKDIYLEVADRRFLEFWLHPSTWLVHMT